MHDFPFAITFIILILAFIFVFLLIRKLRAAVFLPDKRPSAKLEAISQLADPVDAEHVAVIHAVLTHRLGAKPESLRVTRIKPL